MKPAAVIFDIGNVLIEWVPERYFDARSGEASRRELFAEVDLHAMNAAIDLGTLLDPAVRGWSARHPRWADEIACWRDDWIAIAGPEITGTSAALRALKARGVPVFALSNIGTETMAMAQAHWPVLGEFDRTYVSAELHLAKPDPAIYRAVERDCGLRPDRLFFTDDRAENIAAAAARGWRVHRFDGSAGLIARLVAEGLLEEGEIRV